MLPIELTGTYNNHNNMNIEYCVVCLFDKRIVCLDNWIMSPNYTSLI